MKISTLFDIFIIDSNMNLGVFLISFKALMHSIMEL